MYRKIPVNVVKHMYALFLLTSLDNHVQFNDVLHDVP